MSSDGVVWVKLVQPGVQESRATQIRYQNGGSFNVDDLCDAAKAKFVQLPANVAASQLSVSATRDGDTADPRTLVSTIAPNAESTLYIHAPAPSPASAPFDSPPATACPPSLAASAPFDSPPGKSLPCASLGKPDGVNNDPLFSARKARVVTVSEIDRGSDIKEKRFKEITGEEGEVFAKTMYGKEISFQPIMKATFFVNDLPSIMEQGEFRVGRRCAIVPMRVSFVNRNTEAGRAEAEALREMGQPEALIVDLDPGYFETHVVGNEKAFLNFMVQGARLFYSTGRMCVPESLNEHVRGSNTEEAKDVVRAFVEEKLYVSCGQRVLTKTLYKAFKDYIGQEVDFLSFSMDDFGVELKKSIATKGGEWCTVVKKQGSVQGVKGKMWVNLCVRDGV